MTDGLRPALPRVRARGRIAPPAEAGARDLPRDDPPASPKGRRSRRRILVGLLLVGAVAAAGAWWRREDLRPHAPEAVAKVEAWVATTRPRLEAGWAALRARGAAALASAQARWAEATASAPQGAGGPDLDPQDPTLAQPTEAGADLAGIAPMDPEDFEDAPGPVAQLPDDWEVDEGGAFLDTRTVPTPASPGLPPEGGARAGPRGAPGHDPTAPLAHPGAGAPSRHAGDDPGHGPATEDQAPPEVAPTTPLFAAGAEGLAVRLPGGLHLDLQPGARYEQAADGLVLVGGGLLAAFPPEGAPLFLAGHHSVFARDALLAIHLESDGGSIDVISGVVSVTLVSGETIQVPPFGRLDLWDERVDPIPTAEVGRVLKRLAWLASREGPPHGPARALALAAAAASSTEGTPRAATARRALAAAQRWSQL